MGRPEPPGALSPRHVRTPLSPHPALPVGWHVPRVKAIALCANQRFILSRIRTSFRKPGKSPKLAAALAATAIAAATAAAGPLAGLGSAGTPTAAHISTQAAPARAVTPLGNQRLAVATHSPGRVPVPVTLTAAAVTQRQAALRRAQRMLGHFGWGHRQWNPLYKLWNRESSWNKTRVTRTRARTGSRRPCRAPRWPARAGTGGPTPPPRSAGGCATSSPSTATRARLEPRTGLRLVLTPRLRPAGPILR